MKGQFPRRFGKYVLLKPLAKGGMGEIYLAAGGEVGGFEKLCVIKKVITEKSDTAKANRFLDEAKVVLRLSHAALVHTFDAGEVEGAFYIAMELVEGKDLREVWNRCVRIRQRIPLDVAMHIARELARALSYVHAYGELKLVHRDVAPPNILLAYVGDVKLTDFGLARSILKQEHTAPGVVFGRAAYLSPEQARGEVADARTDIYTLGIVLWELLTGQQFLQLTGMDPATALAVVRNPKVAAPSSRAPWISSSLDAVMMRALAVNRAERYQSAEEMRQGLAGVIAEVAPQADAGRVAEFLRSIYKDTIAEERTEREHFLKEVIPHFRITTTAEMKTSVDELPRPFEPPAEAPPPAAIPAARPAADMAVPDVAAVSGSSSASAAAVASTVSLFSPPPLRARRSARQVGLPGVAPMPPGPDSDAPTTVMPQPGPERRSARRNAALAAVSELRQAPASAPPAPMPRQSASAPVSVPPPMPAPASASNGNPRSTPASQAAVRPAFGDDWPTLPPVRQGPSFGGGAASAARRRADSLAQARTARVRGALLVVAIGFLALFFAQLWFESARARSAAPAARPVPAQTR